MVENELAHAFAICGTTCIVAHGINEQAHILARYTHGFVEAHEHDNHLSVSRGFGCAQAFDAYLMELAQASFLGTFRAKHRACVEDFAGAAPCSTRLC